MTNLGAMTHYLSVGSQREANEYVGLKIVSASLNKEADPEYIEIAFEGGKTIQILDNGQSCCESRYITCEDDFASLVGGSLIDIETKAAPDIEDKYGVHEQVFVEIKTDKGFVSFTTHNEHNGYYGGFGLTIKETTTS